MKIIEQSFCFNEDIDGQDILKKIEKALEELYNGFMKLYQMKKKKRKFPGMIPWRM